MVSIGGSEDGFWKQKFIIEHKQVSNRRYWHLHFTYIEELTYGNVDAYDSFTDRYKVT